MSYPAVTDVGLCAQTQRAPETLHPRPSGATISQQSRFACFYLRAVHGAAGERGEGGKSLARRNTGRCALTASRKNESPVPAAFSTVR
jgi:hypothetical protein